MSSVGRSTEDPGYLQILLSVEDTRQVVLGIIAENKLDALVYATFDHQPAEIPSDAMTNPSLDTSRIGNNRRLSPILSFPAMTCRQDLQPTGSPGRNRVPGSAVLRGNSIQVRIRLRTSNAPPQTIVISPGASWQTVIFSSATNAETSPKRRKFKRGDAVGVSRWRIRALMLAKRRLNVKNAGRFR